LLSVPAEGSLAAPEPEPEVVPEPEPVPEPVPLPGGALEPGVVGSPASVAYGQSAESHVDHDKVGNEIGNGSEETPGKPVALVGSVERPGSFAAAGGTLARPGEAAVRAAAADTPTVNTKHTHNNNTLSRT
jgi:hypothetical protein